MDGELVALDRDEIRWVDAYTAGVVRPPVLPWKALRRLVLGGAWMVAMEPVPVGERVWLLERRLGTVRAQFLFEGEVRVSARFLDGELVLFDEAGRLARVDLARGEVRRMVPR